MAGYSNKTIVDKLGVKPGHRVVVLRAPADYVPVLDEIAQRATLLKRLGGRFDVIQYFASSREQLQAVMPNLALNLVPDGMLWMCWAKQTSPLHSGLTDSQVRAAGLAAGLVDVKVAAVSDDWSGLKFVYRLKDR